MICRKEKGKICRKAQKGEGASCGLWDIVLLSWISLKYEEIYQNMGCSFYLVNRLKDEPMGYMVISLF